MMEATQALFTIIVSLKLAVFLAVLVQVGLMSMVERRRKQGILALGLMAAAFFVVSLVEFLHFMYFVGSDDIFYLIVNSLYVVASIGIFWYIWEMKTHTKEYK